MLQVGGAASPVLRARSVLAASSPAADYQAVTQAAPRSPAAAVQQPTALPWLRLGCALRRCSAERPRSAG